MSRHFPLFWRRALKATHVGVAAFWLGAALILVVLQLPDAETLGERVRGVTYAMTLIDDFVIIPATVVVFLSGILYGVGTPWGFFRYDWVVAKWVGTVLFMAFGALALGPWIDGMDVLAQEHGAAVFARPEYASARLRVALWGGIQTFLLGGLVAISIYKPWGKRD